MSTYKPIPVETARQIAREFDKQIVIICAWSAEHELLHTTTYGATPEDKIKAANGGETCAKALGMDISKKDFTEDFRTLGAAKNARLRDVADGLIHALRSYEHGNTSPELAKQFADKIESIIKQ